MCGQDDEAEEDYAALIRAVRQVFADRESMSTVELAKAIAKLEDSPRADWWGKDIAEAMRNPETADAIYKKLGQRVARDLRDFAKPIQLWIDGRKLRGYRREDLQDAFDTYAPEDPSANGRDGSNGRPQVDDGASDQGSTVPTLSIVSTEGLGGPPEGDGGLPESMDPAELRRVVQQIVDAHHGNRFAAGSELNEMGIPTPNGEAAWTAVLVDRVLREVT
jgi:hypothetical protein